jgi:HAD superfamily hydrolase (TIGR01484 family)
MQPLNTIPTATLKKIHTVFFDIDDTLTTEGRLTAHAYTALEALKSHGITTAAITGRPAGWCDHIARMWPVDGVVGENGAFYFYFDQKAKKCVQHFLADAATRATRRTQMAQIAARIMQAVPGCAMASDQAYREADIAIDFCEDVPRLPEPAVTQIHAMMVAAGLQAKISSIHVNGWFGDYDKLSTCKIFARDVLAIDLAAEATHCLFLGDSPNDAPMFEFFPNAIGVANVADMAHLLSHKPAYITQGRGGEGFAEVAAMLLKTQQ